jgi:hypothetical protein
MDVIVDRCAGLDVRTKTVIATLGGGDVATTAGIPPR